MMRRESGRVLATCPIPAPPRVVGAEDRLTIAIDRRGGVLECGGNRCDIAFNLNLSSVSDMLCRHMAWHSFPPLWSHFCKRRRGSGAGSQSSRACSDQIFHGRGAGPNGGSCSRLCLYLRRMLQQVQ